MKNKIAFIFPAFITDFTEKELELLDQHGIDLDSYILKIAEALQLDLPVFKYDSSEYASNELYSQLLAYAFSCAFNDILNSKNIFPDTLAGYSMGIYAALYASRSVNMEDGARLINYAYNLVNEITQTKLYGMAAIVGLTVNDINTLIVKNNLDLEIINVNNEHSLVIAGEKREIAILLHKAKEEGAITTAELTVNTPYHSKYLLKYANPFKEYLETISFKDTTIPIVSTFDQRVVNDISEIKAELIYNLTQKINWYKTMLKLLENNIEEIYECGAGKDLKKISRFIKGEYKIKSI